MAAWDLAFLLLVALPVVSGGIWVHTEKFFLEYTNPAPALALLSAWLFFRARQGKPIRISFVYRKTRAAWICWEKTLGERPRLALTIATCLVTLIWFLAALRRHLAFSSGAADLGIFTNAIWNLSHGNGYVSSIKGGISLLADHQSYFFFLFAPLYAICSSPILLLFLQSAGLASTGAILYCLARRTRVSPRLAALLPFLFWAYAPVRNANLFDFHPEVFLLPLGLLSIWALEGGSWLSIPFTLLALSTKESAAPVFVGIAFVFLLRKNAARALPLLLFSLALFFVNLKLVPAHFGHGYSYGDVYSGWREEPLSFLLRAFHLSRWKFLFGTLAPLAFLPLFSPVTFVAALPGYAMLFFTTGDQRLSLGFHYATEAAVGIFWALCAALASDWGKAREKKIFFVLLLAAGLFYGRSEIRQIRWFSPTAHQAWLQDALLPAISPGASISASSALVPHLANRPWIHFLPEVKKANGEFVDCLVHDSSVNNTPMSDAGWDAVRNSSAFALEYRCATLEVHHASGKQCLTQIPTCRD